MMSAYVNMYVPQCYNLTISIIILIKYRELEHKQFYFFSENVVQTLLNFLTFTYSS